MGPCYCGYFLHIVAFVGNCSAVTAYQQATSLTIKIQFIVLTVRLMAVMISWLHGAVVWLPLGLVQQFCVWTLFDCACGVQGRRHTGSDGKHNRTPLQDHCFLQHIGHMLHHCYWSSWTCTLLPLLQIQDGGSEGEHWPHPLACCSQMGHWNICWEPLLSIS